MHFIDLERLGQIVVCALFHRIDRRVRGRKRRNDEDYSFRRGRLHRLQDRHAIGFRHAEVGDDEIEDFLAYMTDGFFAIRRFGHDVTRAFEHDAQNFAQPPLVINN